MGTIVQSTSCLHWKNNLQFLHPSQTVISQDKTQSRTRTAAISTENLNTSVNNEELPGVINRRRAVASGIALVSSAAGFGFAGDGLAVVKQGLLAGRVPGLSEPDEQG